MDGRRTGVSLDSNKETITKNFITLVTLNVNGIKERRKRTEIQMYLKNYDVICLQETHAQVAEVDKWRLWPQRRKAASHGTGASKGVITICKEGMDMEEKTAEGGRIVSSIAQWDGEPLHIINIYAPNVNNTIAAKKQYGRFLESLNRVLQENDEKKILLGDFNLIMNNVLDTGLSNQASFYPELVEKLEDILNNNDLCDAWRAMNNDEPTFTYKGATQSLDD